MYVRTGTADIQMNEIRQMYNKIKTCNRINRTSTYDENENHTNALISLSTLMYI